MISSSAYWFVRIYNICRSLHLNESSLSHLSFSLSFSSNINSLRDILTEKNENIIILTACRISRFVTWYRASTESSKRACRGKTKSSKCRKRKKSEMKQTDKRKKKKAEAQLSRKVVKEYLRLFSYIFLLSHSHFSFQSRLLLSCFYRIRFRNGH